jgi:holin-like protein
MYWIQSVFTGLTGLLANLSIVYLTGEIHMKKAMKILIQVAVIIIICKLGEAIQAWSQIPIPGSIIGLLILFILLIAKVIPEKWIMDGSNFLLSIMTLLFVPATVGIMNYFHIFQGKGWLLILFMILSTVLVMLGSGFVAEKWGKKSVEQEDHFTA